MREKKLYNKKEICKIQRYNIFFVMKYFWSFSYVFTLSPTSHFHSFQECCLIQFRWNYFRYYFQSLSDKSVSFEKSVSFSDDIQGVPKSHSPQHPAGKSLSCKITAVWWFSYQYGFDVKIKNFNLRIFLFIYYFFDCRVM